MKRIVIIGSGGSGKSTFARKLGDKLKLPVIHLDSLYWKPNWQKVSKDEWLKIQHEIVKGKEWIIDGNYKSTKDIRFAAADTIIFLDFPKWLCLLRSMQRRLMYHNKTRADLGGNNYERTTWQFLWWIFNYPRKDVLDKLEQLKDKNVIRLKNPRELDKFLASVN